MVFLVLGMTLYWTHKIDVIDLYIIEVMSDNPSVDQSAMSGGS